MLDYLWIIPALPLAGVLANGFLGYRLGRRFVAVVGPGVVGLSFLSSVAAWMALLTLPAEERHIEQVLWTWVLVGDWQVSAAILLDPLSMVMVLVVTGVGFLIHVYSVGYMAEDASYARYFAYLNLFTFSMLTLVLANNFLQLYVGWELVGLCSYLLIGFWFTRKAAAEAGKKAFIVNRVGDFGFALGVMLIFVTFGTMDYGAVFARAQEVLVKAPLNLGGAAVGIGTLITFLLFVGATGKSAQIPLYVWLPDAMEGPTPVSALIHAATMVTAGVYMVARTHALYMMAPEVMTVVATVGAVTALYAASIGMAQNDIKRVLAYSTISQLGYMFLGVGVGAFAAGIFHLITHAFFKALLFLGAGSVMHALGGQTNMQRMGGLRAKLPITYATFLVGALALSGFPGFSGFFSKDEILHKAYVSALGSPLLWLIGLVTAGMTAFYIFRVVFLTFHGESRLSRHEDEHVHEAPPVMSVPLLLLAILATVGGYIGMPAILGGFAPFDHFLEPVFTDAHVGVVNDSAATTWSLLLASILVVVSGMAVAYYAYVVNPEVPGRVARAVGPLYTLVVNKYYVDEIYTMVIVVPLRRLAEWLAGVIDMTVIDGAANGVARLVHGVGGILRLAQTGYVRSYALALLAGIVALLGYIALK